jgi:hypothetical protein
MSISASISSGVGSIPIVENSRVPVNTDRPALSGDFLVGTVATCSDGIWTNDPTEFSYQWYRDSREIPLAFMSTYLLINLDREKTISCLVTATNDFGSGDQFSDEVFITA